jgi:hypothetical protein
MITSKEINTSCESQPIVVVLGMHRGGTSVVTRALQTIGVSLGERLMPGVPGVNDKGFFEDLDIFNLNERLLNAVGHMWHSISILKECDIDRLCEQGYLKEAIDLLHIKSKSAKIFGFKDPRTAKLLPFWLRVFKIGNFNARYVIVVRNPRSVVNSLLKRDGFAPEKSYLLWAAHVLTSLRETSEDSRVLVDYDQLVAAPENTLSNLAAFLNTNINEIDKITFLDDFLSKDLRHSYYLPQDVESDNSALKLVQESYIAISDIATIAKFNKYFVLPPQFDQWEAEFHRIQPLFRYIDRLNKFVTEREVQINTLNQALNERADQISKLSSTEYILLEKIAEHTMENKRLEEKNKRLDTDLKLERAKIFAQLNSKSWRMTAPLRKMGDWCALFKSKAKSLLDVLNRFKKRIFHPFKSSVK